MIDFSERSYQPGFVEIAMIHGAPLSFDYKTFCMGENGLMFEVSNKYSVNKSIFVPYNVIAYVKITHEEVDDNE